MRIWCTNWVKKSDVLETNHTMKCNLRDVKLYEINSVVEVMFVMFQ